MSFIFGRSWEASKAPKIRLALFHERLAALFIIAALEAGVHGGLRPLEVALALVDVIRSQETVRMRVCEAFDCEGVLLDLSRNASKQFCSVRCGNRMNMVAFRARGAVSTG